MALTRPGPLTAGTRDPGSHSTDSSPGTTARRVCRRSRGYGSPATKARHWGRRGGGPIGCQARRATCPVLRRRLLDPAAAWRNCPIFCHKRGIKRGRAGSLFPLPKSSSFASSNLPFPPDWICTSRALVLCDFFLQQQRNPERPRALMVEGGPAVLAASKFLDAEGLARVLPLVAGLSN